MKTTEEQNRTEQATNALSASASAPLRTSRRSLCYRGAPLSSVRQRHAAAGSTGGGDEGGGSQLQPVILCCVFKGRRNTAERGEGPGPPGSGRESAPHYVGCISPLPPALMRPTVKTAVAVAAVGFALVPPKRCGAATGQGHGYNCSSVQCAREILH